MLYSEGNIEEEVIKATTQATPVHLWKYAKNALGTFQENNTPCLLTAKHLFPNASQREGA